MSTHKISIAHANDMIQSYLDSINASSDNSNLHSLIFDADELREYLATDNGAIKKIKVMFAHTLQYISDGHEGENAGYKRGALTLIIAGFDANNDYVYWDTNSVMDNGTECPALCPTSGTAANDLLS